MRATRVAPALDPDPPTPMLDKSLVRCGNARLAALLVSLSLPGAALAQDGVDGEPEPNPVQRAGTISVPISAQGLLRRTSNLATTPARVQTGLVEIGDSTSVAVTLEHAGQSGDDPVVIEGVSFAGKSADEYAVDFPGPATLRAGESLDVTVTFTPRVPGDKSATLRFDVAGASVPYIVLVDGESRFPLVAELEAGSSTLGFGQAITGSQQTQTLVLTNTGFSGAPAVNVLQAQLVGDNPDAFAVDFAPTSLQPGESLEVPITFGSAAEGTKNAALEIVHDGNNFTLDIALQGDVIPPGNIEPVFGQSTVQMNHSVNKGTTLQFGPDGKLYLGEWSGLIHIFDVVRNGKNNYQATKLETITSIKDVPNHDDDGSPNNSLPHRQMTGLHVTGTADAPVIYAASSDMRIGGGGKGDLNLDTNSGILHRLTKTGGGWQKEDLVRGLPRSEENHGPNGLLKLGNKIYLLNGGNTNQGRPSENFGGTSEYALSAALLEIDLGGLGALPYDLPTLDDEDRPGVNDANDPFGGNDGKNQAKLVQGGPVRIFSSGLRNAYDVVYTQAGEFYTIDNGSNAPWGDVPGPGCSNTFKAFGGSTDPDGVHRLYDGYYAGHPNPVRGNKDNTFNDSNPQSPIEGAANPVECEYRIPGQDGALTTMGVSVNGLTEYTASNFAGGMQGDLLTVGFNKKLWRLELGANGQSVTSKSVLVGNFAKAPLDVTALGDDGPFPGTIWVLFWDGTDLTVFEPDDY